MTTPPRRHPDDPTRGYELPVADAMALDPALLAEWLDTLAADPMAFGPMVVAALASAAADTIRMQAVVVSTVPDDRPDPAAPLTEAEVAEVDALVLAIHERYTAIPGGRAGFLAEPGGWLDYLGTTTLGTTTDLRLPDEWEDRISLAAIERIQGEWQSGVSYCRHCRLVIRYHPALVEHGRDWLHVPGGLWACEATDDTFAEPPAWYAELPTAKPVAQCHCEWVSRRTQAPHPHRPDLDCPDVAARPS